MPYSKLTQGFFHQVGASVRVVSDERSPTSLLSPVPAPVPGPMGKMLDNDYLLGWHEGGISAGLRRMRRARAAGNR